MIVLLYDVVNMPRGQVYVTTLAALGERWHDKLVYELARGACAWEFETLGL